MNRARYLWQLAWLVAFVVLWVDEERHLIPGYDVVGAVVAGTEISVALFLGVMSVVLLVGYAFYGLALAVTYAVKLALNWSLWVIGVRARRGHVSRRNARSRSSTSSGRCSTIQWPTPSTVSSRKSLNRSE